MRKKSHNCEKKSHNCEGKKVIIVIQWQKWAPVVNSQLQVFGDKMIKVKPMLQCKIKQNY